MCVQDNHGIKDNPTTTHNPLANAIIERVHKVVVCQWYAQIIWLGNNHENIEEQEDNPFYYFIQSSAWSSRY
jgi:hypothetical protein